MNMEFVKKVIRKAVHKFIGDVYKFSSILVMNDCVEFSMTRYVESVTQHLRGTLNLVNKTGTLQYISKTSTTFSFKFDEQSTVVDVG